MKYKDMQRYVMRRISLEKAIGGEALKRVRRFTDLYINREDGDVGYLFSA
jgi:hypothetical protein